MTFRALLAFFLFLPSPGRPGGRLRHPIALLRAAVLCVAIASMNGTGVVSAQRKFDAREVQATYLFNFSQFVTWPAAAFAAPDAPLILGVLGADPLGPVLDAAVRGEVINGHPLVVQRFGRLEDLGPCHILFISDTSEREWAAALKAVRERPILTVGDADGFAADGGAIQFVLDKNRIRLRINVGAARAAGLEISSQLLRIAEVVGGTRP